VGIPVIGSASVFCNNESIVKNPTAPESTLKKCHNVITYHYTREAQAVAMIHMAWENGESQIGPFPFL
jgi:hypothetical protein